MELDLNCLSKKNFYDLKKSFRTKLNEKINELEHYRLINDIYNKPPPKNEVINETKNIGLDIQKIINRIRIYEEKYFRYLYNLDLENATKYKNKITIKYQQVLDILMFDVDTSKINIEYLKDNSKHTKEGCVLQFSNKLKSIYENYNNLFNLAKQLKS